MVELYQGFYPKEVDMKYVVSLRYDSENHIYFIYESDIPGLHVEAATCDEVFDIVFDVAPDLLGDAATKATFDFRVEREATPA